MAIKDGIIDKDSVNKDDRKEYCQTMRAYMEKRGLRPQQELYRQFISQKPLRATYTENQLQEVLTNFWFNHFNASVTIKNCAMYIPAYERDVIRPNVFRKFGDLLLATAKSPTMLFYLDNFSSMCGKEEAMEMMTENSQKAKAALVKIKKNKKVKGLTKLR